MTTAVDPSPEAGPSPRPDVEQRCRRVRERILRMCASSSGGHLGGSMSLVEILVQLYTEVLDVGPDRVDDRDRDFFVLSKGHGALCLYAVLRECGFVPDALLDTYGRPDGSLLAHPTTAVPGVEVATGSLGHGLPVALGVAVAAGLRGSARRAVAVLGDGELQEGSNWEAAMYAGSRGVANLMAIVDRNGLQITGSTEDTAALEPLTDRWAAFGWEVRAADGHDTSGGLLDVLSRPSTTGRPVVVVARTEKGHGVAPVAGRRQSHFATLRPAQLRKVLAALGGEATETEAVR